MYDLLAMRKILMKSIGCYITIFFFMGQIAWAQENLEEIPPQPNFTEEEANQAEVSLPTINELYLQAQAYGITADWSKQIELNPKDYKTMTTPKRAFEVGLTLSNIAFIVLNEKTGQSPDKALIQQAYDAIISLNPPSELSKELQQMHDELESGTLKGDSLRQKANIMLAQAIPAMMERDPNLRDTGTLVLAAGYFRAMYLGTQTVSSYPNPTSEQLKMFQWGSLVSHFANYFSQKAAPEFKNNSEVKNLIIALKKIEPLLKNPTREQLMQVANTLKPLFN